MIFIIIKDIVLVSWIEFLVMLVVGGQNVILDLRFIHDLDFALEGALEMIGMVRADMNDKLIHYSHGMLHTKQKFLPHPPGGLQFM